MNNEYIRREDAKDALQEKVFHNLTDEFYGAMQVIDELEPADVAPVEHGRWIKYTGIGRVQWMCSECGAEEKNPKVANYCYHCGAKMDAQGEE